MKAGWRTSEFWLNLVAQGLAILMVVLPMYLDGGHWAIQVAGGLLSALSAMGYGNARSKLKAAEALKVNPTQPPGV